MIRKNLPIALFIFCVFLLYLSHLSRSVYGGDVGDLVTTASLMGVAHPPGYPLFTLLGFWLTRVTFFHLTQAFLVGLISVFSATGGLVAFYFLSFSLSKNRLSSFLATTILAFSFFYWFYAEIAEVFALNSLFAILLFLCAILYRKKPSYTLFFLFSLLLGLSLTNHQTIVLIFPSLFLLVVSSFWNMVKRSKKSLLFFPLGLILGLLPYIYVPIAASHHAIINWDNVHDIRSFLHLVLRQDYGTFQAGVFEQPTFWQRLLTLKVYLLYVISQLTIPVVFLSFLGIGVMWKRDRILSLALLLAFLISGPIFITYAGFPLTGSFILGVYERFFLLSSIILLIPFSVGILWLSTLLSSLLSRKIYITVFQLVFFIIPLTLLFYNFPKTDLSSVTIGDTYSEDLLNALPLHTLLVFNGDTLVFNTWYVHYVRNVRPDVSLYNFGGELQNKSANAVLQTEKIEKQADSKIDSLVNTLIERSKSRPVFSSILFEPTKDTKKITWIPLGLVYELHLSSDPLPPHDGYIAQQEKIWSSFRIPTVEDEKKNVYHNLTIAEFPTAFSDTAVATGTFIYTHYADSTNAVKYYKKAIEIDSGNAKAYETLGAYYMGVGGKCPEIAENLTAAIQLNPFEKLPYFLLYATYKDCFHDEASAKKIATQFGVVFQQDFAKEIKKQIPNELFSQ